MPSPISGSTPAASPTNHACGAARRAPGRYQWIGNAQRRGAASVNAAQVVGERVVERRADRRERVGADVGVRRAVDQARETPTGSRAVRAAGCGSRSRSAARRSPPSATRRTGTSAMTARAMARLGAVDQAAANQAAAAVGADHQARLVAAAAGGPAARRSPSRRASSTSSSSCTAMPRSRQAATSEASNSARRTTSHRSRSSCRDGGRRRRDQRAIDRDVRDVRRPRAPPASVVPAGMSPPAHTFGRGWRAFSRINTSAPAPGRAGATRARWRRRRARRRR